MSITSSVVSLKSGCICWCGDIFVLCLTKLCYDITINSPRKHHYQNQVVHHFGALAVSQHYHQHPWCIPCHDSFHNLNQFHETKGVLETHQVTKKHEKDHRRPSWTVKMSFFKLKPIHRSAYTIVSVDYWRGLLNAGDEMTAKNQVFPVKISSNLFLYYLSMFLPKHLNRSCLRPNWFLHLILHVFCGPKLYCWAQ